jgi:uncharacterized protein YuzE
MKLSYYADTDTLYIDLANRPGADVVEVGEGVVVDVDAAGVPVGIEIDGNASRVADLSRLELHGLTLSDVVFTREKLVRETG